MKILLSASVPSSVPPAGTRSALVGSSLIVTVTSPLGDQLALGDEQQRHHQQDHAGEHRHAEEDLAHAAAYSWIPENIMNASDISPAVMNVMPRPFRPSGTCE